MEQRQRPALRGVVLRRLHASGGVARVLGDALTREPDDALTNEIVPGFKTGDLTAWSPARLTGCDEGPKDGQPGSHHRLPMHPAIFERVEVEATALRRIGLGI